MRLRWFLLGLTALLVLALLTLLVGRQALLNYRAAAAAGPKVVEIPKGAGLTRVAAILSQAKITDRPGWFMLAARLAGSAGRLQAGEYRLSAAMSNRDLLEMLSQGKVIQHRVTIPEGLRLYYIIDRLAKAEVVDRDKALALARDQRFIASLGLDDPNLEGYLFPDTYRFPRRAGARKVLTVMVRRFWRHWRPLAQRARALGLNRREAVTLASIVEAEARVAEERSLISAVYLNRLRKGMRLQADPTVAYGLGLNGPPLRRHLEKDNPYNTYLRPGLPPGPICSPGAASLKAAVIPARVDYLYFVAKGQGQVRHTFSRTHKQHQRAVKKLMRNLRQQ